MKGAAARPLSERLLARRMIDPLFGCWTWTAGRGGYRCEYGVVGVGSMIDGTRRQAYVHRVAYELWVGPIADDLQIDHVCHNTLCFNPAHLDMVTPAVNSNRTLEKGHRAVRTVCAKGHDLEIYGRVCAESPRLRRCRLCVRVYMANYRKRKAAEQVARDAA